MIMVLQTIVAGVLMDETTTVSLAEVCEKYHISEDLLREMIEQGLFNHPARPSQTIHIDQRALTRIQSACRLQEDLDINLPGVVLVLELLEELEHVRDELIILRHHVGE